MTAAPPGGGPPQDIDVSRRADRRRGQCSTVGPARRLSALIHEEDHHDSTVTFPVAEGFRR